MDRIRNWMTLVPGADPQRMQAPLDEFVHALDPPARSA
jgi:hypothetical protein